MFRATHDIERFSVADIASKAVRSAGISRTYTGWVESTPRGMRLRPLGLIMAVYFPSTTLRYERKV